MGIWATQGIEGNGLTDDAKTEANLHAARTARPRRGSTSPRSRLAAAALALTAVALGCAPGAAPEAPSAAASGITLGNGTENWIVTEGATRRGATFRFREVRIADDGWLVMHPFADGKPVGEIYVGARYLAAGTHREVEIRVDEAPEPGTPFLVMLHSDVNGNGEFDFVFVDERNVLDKAVFEGTTMIACGLPMDRTVNSTSRSSIRRRAGSGAVGPSNGTAEASSTGASMSTLTDVSPTSMPTGPLGPSSVAVAAMRPVSWR